MRKTLTLTLLAASTLAVASSSTLCFAEEVANSPTVASPAATVTQSSQHETHHLRQINSDEQDQNKSTEDQSLADDSAKGQTEEQPQEAVATTAQLPVENAPSPSQRDMRQHIREAQRNIAPAAANQ